MKRIIAIFSVLCLLLGMLISCGGKKDPSGITPPGGGGPQPSPLPGEQRPGEEKPGQQQGTVTIPEGLTGTDVLKLLLAGTRLAGKMIGSTDSIFKSGVQTMRTLAERAEANRGVRHLTARADAKASFGAQMLSSSGKEITEFDAISRNCEEFKSTTDSIVSNAQKAAGMIDYVKTHVRILDTWVVTPAYGELLLHVEEDLEIIFSRDAEHDSAFMCRRYANEVGDDVYEVWERSSFADVRFLYVAGKRYEMFYKMDDGARYQGICANNDKEYWEIFNCIYDSRWVDSPFDPCFIILKDDVCYQASYSFIEWMNSVTYKITSPDKSCDILTVTEDESAMRFEINLGAFSGYYGVVDIDSGNVGKLKLSDGRLLSEMDGEFTLASGSIAQINGIRATESAFGKEGAVMITISGASKERCRADLLVLLQEWGFTSRYDLSHVFALADLASEEFEAMRKYLRWNGHAVDTVENALKGVAVEVALFDSYEDMYKEYENLPKVQMQSEEAALLMQFAAVKTLSVQSVNAIGLTVSIASASLTVEDTLLFVKDQNYKVAFALRSLSGGNLVHLACETAPVAYSGAGAFTVAAESISLQLPLLSVGEYELVAYIATAEGIRASAPAVIPIEVASGEAVKGGNIKGEVVIEAGASKVVYSETADAVAVIYGAPETSYAEFYEKMAEVAFVYGIPSEQKIEKVDPETMAATALTGEEASIEEGTYRIYFSATNGEIVTKGYVYVAFVHEILPASPSEEGAELSVDPADA